MDCDSVGSHVVNEAHLETAMPGQRDRFIPQRKSDVVTGGTLAGDQEASLQETSLRRFARVLGAIIHHQHFEELDRLREAYFYFDPEVGAEACRPARDLEQAYRT